MIEQLLGRNQGRPAAPARPPAAGDHLRTAGKTVLLYVVPGLLIASGWLGLQRTSDRAAAAGILVVALAPALVPRWARVPLALALALVVVSGLFGVSVRDARPFDEERNFFGPMFSTIAHAAAAFSEVSPPFDATAQPEMRAVVLLAIFGFALAVALAVAARRPVLAAAVFVAGSVWPATLAGGSTLARGAITLATVLGLLAFGNRRTVLPAARAAVALGVVVVAAAVTASGSEAVAKDGFVNWRGWDFYEPAPKAVGVDYVWTANYDGIDWPDRETVVLNVEGPRRSLYWRATTLNRFDDDRWVEGQSRRERGRGRRQLSASPLVPRARDPRRWVRASLTVEGLRDEYLVAPATPVVYDTGSLLAEYHAAGDARATRQLRRGDRYTVWSYTPRPTPRELARARLAHAGELREFLEIAPGTAAPPFGAPGHAERVDAMLRRSAPEYAPLARAARRVVGDPANPYAAVVALESWFRSEGGFTYDEQPPAAPAGVPPLVAFVRGHQRGYCQLYAGAMALMLRHLGIPARVAVGFTSGDWDGEKRRWTVTDRDAHAWVEVWFDGWGWLTFDPTPGRGALSSPYSYASPVFAAAEAAEALGAGTTSGYTAGLLGRLTEAKAGEGRVAPRSAGRSGDRDGRSPARNAAAVLALLALLFATATTVAKVGRRRWRYLTRDPRRLAAAARAEIVEVLVDQHVPVERGATARELAQALSGRYGIDASAFVNAYETARYGPPHATIAAARRVLRERRRLRRQVAAKIGVGRRVSGALALRSLSAR
jgi:transglutaminase-like putative cysteine protease